jgi:hypothetical protein
MINIKKDKKEVKMNKSKVKKERPNKSKAKKVKQNKLKVKRERPNKLKAKKKARLK